MGDAQQIGFLLPFPIARFGENKNRILRRAAPKFFDGPDPVGVRRIDFQKGTIERFAGTGKRGYTGDGGPAKDATFDGPKEIDIDTDGNVYVVDTENEAIRRIDVNSRIVTTVAGKGRTKTPGLGDGGPATAATLGRPHGVAVGPDGAIYIGDTNSHRIRRVK